MNLICPKCGDHLFLDLREMKIICPSCEYERSVRDIEFW